ncbi:MAG TPA: sigma 54-interacting transcriptional regulator [Smithellaceae bacterium]|nr:sigma 54-interacting transcriptional regulator [Smithellaceae bacterium]HRS90292.1 sigma 54-interacting transcriptional regulator [Smithellaceae bacterium]
MSKEDRNSKDIAKNGQPDQSILISALQASLKRYETILDDLDVYMGETDLEGNITFVNDAGCRMMELSRRRLLGLHYKNWTEPQTTERIRQIYEKIHKTGIPEKNIIFEAIDKHGRRRIIDQSISVIRNAQGEITGFRNVALDITERKEAESKLAEHRTRLEAIFSSVKDAIITVNPQLQVIEANKTTESICGLALQEIEGKEFPACQENCSRACLAVLTETIVNKSAVRERRIECLHRKHPAQVVSLSSSPLLGPEGNFMGAVLVIRDITLLNSMERELMERNQFQNIIGRSKAMQNIYGLLEELADIDTTVLIIGESGTGKELVARALHYSGSRALKPFVTVNCSALAESLLESELFGHVKGAFTGAIKDKQGRFQMADGGTILLDEIGDISPLIQLKLLRVLQEKEFERVGEAHPQKVDVRVIASTNKDLKEKVNKGEFRPDLYYRLKVVEVALPPLRERLEDLPVLIDHFLKLFNTRLKKKVEGVSNEVLSVFMNYNWPGNVRELEHVIEHAFVLCHGATITMHHLPEDLRNYSGSGKKITYKGQINKRFEDEEIVAALKKTGGNKAKAAQLLGISRQTIYRRINAK